MKGVIFSVLSSLLSFLAEVSTMSKFIKKEHSEPHT